MAEPVLSWVGGKREEMKILRFCLPAQSSYDAYHEPFVGGGALFFEVAPHQEGSSINDINERLANLYRIIQDDEGYEVLIEKLREITKPATSEPDEGYEFLEPPTQRNYYYQVREQFNQRARRDGTLSWEQRVLEAARLIFLNKTCYNAVYRENRSGEFNVPWGDTETPNLEVLETRIREANQCLKGVQILNRDYKSIVTPGELGDIIREDDLVYFDPPYRGTYNQYHASDFGFEDQIDLRDTAAFLSQEGVYVVLSNSFAMADEYAYNPDFKIVPVGKRRMVNADGTNRDEKIDIIVTNVPSVPDKIVWEPSEIRDTDIDTILNAQKSFINESSTNADLEAVKTNQN